MRIRGAWVAAVGVVMVLATAGLFVMAQAGADTDRCTRFREAARDRASLVTGIGQDVLVIGDSYSVGLGASASSSWPTRLPGEVHVEGFSGSGFSREASPCGRVSYADRAARGLQVDPGVVVVEGGLNDVDQPEAAVVAGFDRVMGQLAGRRVLVVGPAPAPERAHAVPATDALLARLSEEHGVAYLSMADADLAYLEDGLHPTAAGHAEFGERVAQALSTARVPAS